ncbi:MAG: ABC transporter ATP-binding protein [Desulfobacteraceae bacterium]|nr:ABC transporter ATP-binding protein [Desulfobacteraceae bacterium]
MGGGYDEGQGSKHDLRLLKRFVPYIDRNRWMIVLSMVLMLFLSLFDIAVPYITKMAVDLYIVPRDGGLVLESRRVSGAMTAGLALALIAVARFVASFVQIMVMELAGQKIMHDLRVRIYEHIQRLPMVFFTQNTVGRLSTRVTNDIQNMQEMFTTIITFVMKDIFTLTGIILVLLYLDMRLALAVLGVLPLVVWTTALFSARSREVFRNLRAKIAEINSMFSESCGGIRVIQLFSAQERIKQEFKALNHDNFLAGMGQIKLFGLFMPVVDLFGSLVLAIVIFYGGGRVVSDQLTLGTLVAFISYSKMFFRPVRDIAEKHNILQNALASGERIVQIFDEQEADPGGNTGLERIDSIEFREISFAYEPEKPVLDRVSFSVKVGQSLAILGPTGSGKTSLINLIVKFYPRTGGDILINDRGIDSFSVFSLRSRIALVTQDPYLFSGTIRENILPPDSVMTDLDFDRIVELSHVKSVIDKLPQGADTRVSQGGASLSSGERQLISIARAFAHDPELIIFDEATSYVDTESEEKIRSATARLKESRTSITIAHRLRSAVTADRIIVLRQGRVTEAGDHGTLMENRGFYYRLHAMDNPE